MNVLFHKFYNEIIHPMFSNSLLQGRQTITEKHREGMGPELVSDLDRRVENAYREFLGESFQEDQIVGEESGGTWPPETGRTWIIDPCDGTHNILAGLPTFGTMCACVEDGRAISAAIYLPLHATLFKTGLYVAHRGEGAWAYTPTRKKRLKVSTTKKLEDAFLIFEGPTKKVLASPLVQKAQRGSLRFRNGVASCWTGVLVASGENYPAGFDGAIVVNNKPWDNIPISLLVEEAGGKATDFEGNPVIAENCQNIILSNGLIHDVLIALGKEE